MVKLCNNRNKRERDYKQFLARSIDFFGAQRATQMNNSDAPFCIGCSDAELGQFPWQLSLQTTSHFCGGSLLSDIAFATAAHCRKSSYYAIAGTIDNQAGQKIEANFFRGHPNYNPIRILNDYAVGKVSTPFTLNAYAKPIQLVDPSPSRPADGHPLVSSGYGYHQMASNGRPIPIVSQYLKWTDMEYVSVKKCESIWTEQIIDQSIICADAPSTSICSGDSGGPLVIQERGESRLIGLVSWGHVYCKLDGFPQGFANVQWPGFNKWIRQNAGIW